jgi:L-ascorbate metabolism protein UlaG (beta-lactamase superfamily)
VLLSHDHYDHLDEATIRAMSAWDTRFACPLGVGAHLEAWGVPLDRILELDWWDSFTVKGLDIACTPARHFSGRGLFNRRSTLWASWSLVGPSHRVFFSGDSALFGGFAEIGERFGPFDACLMETGSYDPSWPDVHIGPEQAVEAVQALRGKLYVPVHWGTFNLGTHGWTEPVERLLVAAAAAGVPVCVPKPGSSVEPANPPRVERWWPDLPWQGVKEAPVVSTGLGR